MTFNVAFIPIPSLKYPLCQFCYRCLCFWGTGKGVFWREWLNLVKTRGCKSVAICPLKPLDSWCSLSWWRVHVLSVSSWGATSFSQAACWPLSQTSLLLPLIVSLVELSAQAKNSADSRVLASVSCMLASFLPGAWKKPGKGCVLQNRLKSVIGDYTAYK